MKKMISTLCLLLVCMGTVAKKAKQNDRAYWAAQAYQMARPVLENMAQGKLQQNMLTEFSPSFDNRNRKVVYLNRETQERADFIVRRLGDRGSNLSSFVESIVRLHLEEYGEDIEKWRRL